MGFRPKAASVVFNSSQEATFRSHRGLQKVFQGVHLRSLLGRGGQILVTTPTIPGPRGSGGFRPTFRSQETTFRSHGPESQIRRSTFRGESVSGKGVSGPSIPGIRDGGCRNQDLGRLADGPKWTTFGGPKWDPFWDPFWTLLGP